MTVHRTTHPRAWGSAAAASFVAGLAATAGIASAGPVEPTRRAAVARPTFTIAATRVADVIALRPDPANRDRLVVDFGPVGSGGAFDASTYAAIAVDPGPAADRRGPAGQAESDR